MCTLWDLWFSEKKISCQKHINYQCFPFEIKQSFPYALN